MRASPSRATCPGPGRRRRGLVVCALIACTLCVSWTGIAQAQVRASGDYLMRMDRDRDGRVALAEYQDWLSYAFDAMDRDRDGTLASHELPGGRGRPVARGAHRAALAAAFRRQDADRDGFLSASELAAPPR